MSSGIGNQPPPGSGPSLSSPARQPTGAQWGPLRILATVVVIVLVILGGGMFVAGMTWLQVLEVLTE